MTDTFTKLKRRRIMARICSYNTQPERFVAAFLLKQRFALQTNVRNLPGTPDIVIPSRRTVIFVNGCFWHQHSRCKRATLPSTRRHFWKAKLLKNRARDQRVRTELRRLGWTIITVWQCQLQRRKSVKRLASLLSKIRSSPYPRNRRRDSARPSRSVHIIGRALDSGGVTR